MSDRRSTGVDDTRRAVVQSLGGGVVAAFGGIGTVGATSDTIDSGPRLSDFHVEGVQQIRTEVTPEAIVRRERKTSPALKHRYGSETIEETKRLERPAPECDAYPTRTTVTKTLPWDTHFATEDEWWALFTNEVTTDGAESDHPFGVWEYDEVDSGYEKVAPMNVIAPETIPDVAGVLDRNGWTLWVVDYTRWAWNSETEQFEEQHDSVATSTNGTSGRKHMRLWEFGGYVSGSAHVDSPVPHEAVSFDEAEQAVGDIFDDELGCGRTDDYYDLDNGGFGLDHDGSATRVTID